MLPQFHEICVFLKRSRDRETLHEIEYVVIQYAPVRALEYIHLFNESAGSNRLRDELCPSAGGNGE